MVIGVDLDEVLVPTFSSCCVFLNEKYGLNLTEENFYVYDFAKICDVSKKQSVIDWNEFCQSNYFKKLEPYPETLEWLNKLKELRDLALFTGRGYDLMSNTKELIDKYFSGIFIGMYFGNTYSLKGKEISKLDLCKRSPYAVELLIEDNPRHAIPVSKEIPVILFPDKAWNRNIQETENLKKAKNSEKLIEKVNYFLNL